MKLFQFILGLCLISTIIVASGGFLAKAQKTASPQQPQKQTTTQSKPTKAATEPQQAGPKGPLPLLMALDTVKDTYRSQEDIMVKAELWAVQPVTICVYPDHPEANFAVDLYRLGYGKLNIVPNVVQLNHQDLNSIQHIKLDTGQVYRTLFNLKKLVPMPPLFWKTGEYRIQAKFFLCGSTEDAEKGIPSNGPLHVLILE